jgi:RNase P subunit RPR2
LETGFIKHLSTRLPMVLPSLKCPNCPELVIKSQHDQSKIRAKIIVVRDDIVYGVCKGCNSEIRLPLGIDVVKYPNPPLFVGNVAKSIDKDPK